MISIKKLIRYPRTWLILLLVLVILTGAGIFILTEMRSRAETITQPSIEELEARLDGQPQKLLTDEGALKLTQEYFQGVSVTADNVWHWDGGGTTNNWSDAQNWDKNTVPPNNTSTTVIFSDITNKNAIIDRQINIGSFLIGYDLGSFHPYLGTISFAPTITSNSFISQFVAESGTFRPPPNATLYFTQLFMNVGAQFLAGDRTSDTWTGRVYFYNRGAGMSIVTARRSGSETLTYLNDLLFVQAETAASDSSISFRGSIHAFGDLRIRNYSNNDFHIHFGYPDPMDPWQQAKLFGHRNIYFQNPAGKTIVDNIGPSAPCRWCMFSQVAWRGDNTIFQTNEKVTIQNLDLLIDLGTNTDAKPTQVNLYPQGDYIGTNFHLHGALGSQNNLFLRTKLTIKPSDYNQSPHIFLSTSTGANLKFTLKNAQIDCPACYFRQSGNVTFQAVDDQNKIQDAASRSWISVGDLALEGGRFLAPPKTIVGCYLTNNQDVFRHNNGTVFLAQNCRSNQKIKGGNMQFYNLVVTSPGATIYFTADRLYRILNQAIFTSDSAKIQLLSDNPWRYWKIQVDRPDISRFNGLYIQDSANQGTTLTATNSTDGGHNYGWVFQ